MGQHFKHFLFRPCMPNCFAGILADIGEWNSLRNPSPKFSNTNQTLQPGEGLGIEKKNIYWIFSLKVLKQNPTKDFKFNFVWFFSHFTLLWNVTSLVELWGCSFPYYFHIYYFTYSTNSLPVGKLREKQSIMTVVTLRVMEEKIKNIKRTVCPLFLNENSFHVKPHDGIAAAF